MGNGHAALCSITAEFACRKWGKSRVIPISTAY